MRKVNALVVVAALLGLPVSTLAQITTAVVAALLGLPTLTLAQESSKVAIVAEGPIMEAAALQQLAVTTNNSALTASGRQVSGSRSLRLQDANAQSAPSEERSWPARHPILFGILVGAGAGAVAGAFSCEGDLAGLCLLALPGAGAGLGAGTGFIVSQKEWVSRHPVLFGTFIGAMAGFLGGAAACPAYPAYNDNYSCTVRGLTYAGLGAGVGAGGGLIVSLARR